MQSGGVSFFQVNPFKDEGSDTESEFEAIVDEEHSTIGVVNKDGTVEM